MKNEKIKQLRQKTGIGIVECQKALKQAKGDLEKAVEILRKKGQKVVKNKHGRAVNEGVVEAYIHSNHKIGVLIELVCETDFVARSNEFKQLAHDLAMQVAAVNPQWIKPEDVPKKVLDKEKEIAKENLPKGKPSKVVEKIVKGRLQKFYIENCLLEQPFIKNEKIIIKQLIQEKIAKSGENIQVKRFIRFEL
ncbi:elongation factor Ts [Patescibacteria group bacterium]|nr:elongation factor Ts [Patescibacteria group bacterium]